MQTSPSTFTNKDDGKQTQILKTINYNQGINREQELRRDSLGTSWLKLSLESRSNSRSWFTANQGSNPGSQAPSTRIHFRLKNETFSAFSWFCLHRCPLKTQTFETASGQSGNFWKRIRVDTENPNFWKQLVDDVWCTMKIQDGGSHEVKSHCCCFYLRGKSHIS